MNHSHATITSTKAKQFVWIAKETTLELTTTSHQTAPPSDRFAPLQPIRQWLDTIEIHDTETARAFCQLIPARCPFERTIKLFDRTLFSIPPLCKLNPFYEQVVGLRFRALCYLADECGEDVSRYC
ncbi:MAG: Mo-dependent nitrogenase C-terminal domain-containing protein [Tildeniella nuda ZEHNDER 1965/U140]|jgi:hypothetical protein|nr:Mo-dependent nitrogenase C-terminal domain-containing protein [Tildeniella nuda ZEHNDER 1965/U140]